MCMCVYANSFIKIIRKQQKSQKYYVCVINVSLILKKKGILRNYIQPYLSIYEIIEIYSLICRFQGFANKNFVKCAVVLIEINE